MLPEISHHFLLPALFAAGLTAGYVDTIAGGGGLISLPVLLSLGIPPHLALGTNKFQSTFGASMATYSYYRHGLIDKQKIFIGLLFSFFGALIGAVSAQMLSSDVLKKIIPVLLALILIYTLAAPKKIGIHDHPPLISEKIFYSIFGMALGFYDGFLGPGVGAFWVFALTFFLGFNLVKATAYTKVFNLNTNLVTLVCFMAAGNVDYRMGICMAAGQLIGARMGAYLAIKKGTKLIRPLFLSMVTVTIIVLFYKNYSQQLTVFFTLKKIIIFSSMILIYFLFKKKLLSYFHHHSQKDLST